MIIDMIRPKYFMPIEGSYSALMDNKKNALRSGIPEKQVLIADNGQVVEFQNRQGYVTNQRHPIEYIFVDGLGIGDVNHLVLRDRKQLAGDGMVVIVAQVKRNGKVQRIDVISRGLTLVKEQGGLIGGMVRVARQAITDREPRTLPNEQQLREKIRGALERYVFHETQRQPMILPIIVEV